MQSFIKIGGQVSEKSCHEIQRDIHLLLLGYVVLMLINFFGSNLQKYYVELATLLETELY